MPRRMSGEEHVRAWRATQQTGMGRKRIDIRFGKRAGQHHLMPDGRRRMQCGGGANGTGRARLFRGVVLLRRKPRRCHEHSPRTDIALLMRVGQNAGAGNNRCRRRFGHGKNRRKNSAGFRRGLRGGGHSAGHTARQCRKGRQQQRGNALPAPRSAQIWREGVHASSGGILK